MRITRLIRERVDVVVEREGYVGAAGRQVARHQAATRPIQAVVHREVGPATDLHCLHALLHTAMTKRQCYARTCHEIMATVLT